MSMSPIPTSSRTAHWGTTLVATFAVAFASICLPSAWMAPANAQASLQVEEEAETATDLETVAVAAIGGYDNLMADLKFIGEMGGRPEMGNMAEGMLALFTQGRGLVGLDKTRPLGVLLQTDGTNFVPIGCLPIDDLPATLELIEGMGLSPFDAGDGITEIELPQQTIYLKSVGEWTYIGQSPEALASAPADPSDLLKAIAADYDVGVRAMVQKIPDMYRDLALTQLKAGMEEGLQQQEDENDKAFEARRKMATLQIEQIEMLIEGIDELTVGIDLDDDKRSAKFEVAMTAVADTLMAKACAGYQNVTTNLAGFFNPNAAASFLSGNNNSPEVIEMNKEQLASVIGTIRQQVSEGIKSNDELSEAWKTTFTNAFEDVLEVYETFVTSEKIEAGGSVTINEKELTKIGAARVSNSEKFIDALKKIEATLKEEPLPEGAPTPKFEWNADTHGNVTLHHISVSLADLMGVPAEIQEKVIAIVGETPMLTLGTSENYFYVALGANGDEALKAAIDSSAAQADKELKPAATFFISAKQFLDFVPRFLDEEQLAEFEAKAGPFLDIDCENDKLQITVKAMENGFRISYELEEWLLQAIGKGITMAAEKQMQQNF